MPKSSSFTSPSSVTRMLEGFRSRWTINRACAWATARAANEKEPQPGANRQPSGFDVFVNRMPCDVLERQIRLAVGRHAGVVQAGDVRVIQGGQNFALFSHPVSESGAAPGASRQLERDGAIDHDVGALGEPHRPHPACPQLSEDAVWPDRLRPGAESSISSAASPLRFDFGDRLQERARVGRIRRGQKTAESGPNGIVLWGSVSIQSARSSRGRSRASSSRPLSAAHPQRPGRTRTRPLTPALPGAAAAPSASRGGPCVP